MGIIQDGMTVDLHGHGKEVNLREHGKKLNVHQHAHEGSYVDESIVDD